LVSLWVGIALFLLWVATGAPPNAKAHRND
jgi:hypothetical protein